MNLSIKLDKTNKIVVLFLAFAVMFFTSINAYASDTAVISKSVQNLPKINYKKSSKGKGYVVYVNNKQALWFMSGTEKISAEIRAKGAASELQKFVASNSDPKTIKPVRNGSNLVIKAGEQTICTADLLNAKSFGVSLHELAYTWANDTRSALGAPRLLKDYARVSRGSYTLDFERKYLGMKATGMASWYGGNFHGKKSSDGSRYNKEEFTAAHKSLPFGTLVKVKNLRNGKACVVKITDRGPYVHGRILDLSKAGAKEIGIISSGVGKISMEVVGKY